MSATIPFKRLLLLPLIVIRAPSTAAHKKRHFTRLQGLPCRGHHRICSKTYFKRHRGKRSADFAGPNPLFERLGRPDVVAIEADELPADRSDVGEELLVQRFALGAKISRAASIGIMPRSRSVTCSRGMSPTKAVRQTWLRTLDALPRHPSVDHA
jgi:hypothetical protein